LAHVNTRIDLKSNRKKIVLVSTLIVIGAFFLFAFFEWRNRPTNLTSASGDSVESGLAVSIAGKLTELDTDNDGLFDWEERLWGTETTNPDTDGDGTSDGEEVTQNRDPKKKGPNDALPLNQNGLPGGTMLASGSTTNSTADFTAEFLQTYSSLKKDGVPLSAEERDRLATELIAKINATPAINTVVYTENDLNLSADNTTVALRTYGNPLRNATPRHFESEMVIVYNALHKNRDELIKLDVVIKSYNDFLKNALAIPVPSDVKVAHLAILNSVSQLITTIEGMKLLFTDPLTATAHISTYPANATALQDSFATLTAELASYSVTYDREDYGYLLNLII
jgi:hypothetical protein